MTPPNFASLFEAAVKEWPEIISFGEIQQQSGNRYTVGGLGRLLEEIEDPHIGSKEEVVLRELHWSIFTVIHSLAKSLVELSPSSVRAEAVEEIFKRRLRTAIDSKDPRWSAEDFLLAQAYLEEPSR